MLSIGCIIIQGKVKREAKKSVLDLLNDFLKAQLLGSLWGRNKELHQVAHMAQENLHVAVKPTRHHTTPWQFNVRSNNRQRWIVIGRDRPKEPNPSKSPRTWKVICGGLRSTSRRSSAKLDLNLSHSPVWNWRSTSMPIPSSISYILDSRLWVNVVEKCHWRIDERKLGWDGKQACWQRNTVVVVFVAVVVGPALPFRQKAHSIRLQLQHDALVTRAGT